MSGTMQESCRPSLARQVKEGIQATHAASRIATQSAMRRRKISIVREPVSRAFFLRSSHAPPREACGRARVASMMPFAAVRRYCLSASGRNGTPERRSQRSSSLFGRMLDDD
jgi:hypothetical protein